MQSRRLENTPLTPYNFLHKENDRQDLNTIKCYATVPSVTPIRPLLTQLWRSRSQEPGLFPAISADILEHLVYAKLYFDYAGLILAFDEERPVGFAHASFGPNDAESDVDYQMGTTNLVLVRPDVDVDAVAEGLLAQCESYLRRRGAKVLYGRRNQAAQRFLSRFIRRERNAGNYGHRRSCEAGCLRRTAIGKSKKRSA